jgi:hypothetical protein
VQGFQVPALAPGEEANVEYGLMFPTNLPPREFYLNMKIVLGAGDVFVAKPLFNEVRRPPAGVGGAGTFPTMALLRWCVPL